METLKTYEKENVNLGKLTIEISTANCIENFNGLLFSEGEVAVLGDAITNEQTLDNLIANHVISDPLNEEIEKYNQRQYDGKVAIINLMAELRLAAIANGYPRDVNRAIENAFWEVAIAVNNGWWITAKEKCELVPVGGYVTQELWDRIHGKIVAYIAQNY